MLGDAHHRRQVVEPAFEAFGVEHLRHQRQVGHCRLVTMAAQAGTRIAGQLAQCPRPVLALPPSLANVLAWLTEHLPGPTILSRDNLDSMKIDCVIDPAIESLTADALGIKLTALEAVAPRYLAPEQRFDQYRSRAGR